MRINILGGNGWLGKYLIKILNQTHEVKISSRSKNSEQHFAFNFNDVSEIPESDLVVFCIPPSKYKLNELKKLNQLLDTNKPIIYTSSTSIYSNCFTKCTEDLNLVLDESVNEIVFETELFLKNHFKNHCIFRLAGLVGENRNPANFLSGKTNVSNGLGPVNLVHGEDVAQIISLAIEQNLLGIFNVCSDEHPTRAEFYTQACQKANLPIPQFINNLESNKIIDNAKIKNALNYQFKYSSPFNMI